MSDWNIFLENIRTAEQELGNPSEIWYIAKYQINHYSNL